MILGDWAVALNLLSMAGLLVVTLAILQLLLWQSVLRVCRRKTPIEQKYLLLVWASLPWLSPTLAMILGLDATLQADGTLKSSLWQFHWHHADWFFMNSWHSLFLVLGIAWPVWVLYRLIPFTLRQHRQHRRLVVLSGTDHCYPEIYRVPTDDVVAYTSGLLRPRVFVSQGLLDRLAPDQLNIVLAHEQAHVDHADTVTRWLMTVACRLWPAVIGDPVMARYVLVTEQLADRAVADVISATDVASTLVKVARLSRGDSSPQGCPGFWAQGEPHQLSARVSELLASPVASVRFGRSILLLLVLVPLLAVASLDSLHHGIELLLEQ